MMRVDVPGVYPLNRPIDLRADFALDLIARAERAV